MQFGYYQIRVKKEDKYKTTFVAPFGHYKWNVMSMELKNSPSEFQNIMNNILIPYSKFTIVYLDDVLIYSDSIEQHLKQLKIFKDLIKKNGLVVSARKMTIVVTKVRFLGHEKWQGKITPISRNIKFAKKFLDEIKNKTQLQRFLGCLNYVSKFIPKIRIIAKPLFNRLRKNEKPWEKNHTKAVRKIKVLVNNLPCEATLIVETNASEFGFGGVLKQNLKESPEQILKYHSRAWNETQKKNSPLKKEILAIVLCISKFQNDLINKPFLLRIDCKSAKEILEKDLKNIISTDFC